MLVMLMQIVTIMVTDGDLNSDTEADTGADHVCEGDVLIGLIGREVLIVMSL
jgi:hypothetical protein